MAQARPLAQFFERRRQSFFRFVDRRNPAADTFKLSQKNLFVFPTRRGFIFLLVAMSLWILGTNYQNNLIIALAFFMASLFNLAILLTFSNLNRLEIKFRGVNGDAFAKSEVPLRFLLLKKGKLDAEAVEFSWQDSKDISSKDVVPSEEVEQLVPIYFSERGRHALPRLKIESCFPLGIIRCWSWLNIEAKLLVFPTPLNGPVGSSSEVGGEEVDGLRPVKGGDDFSGLRSYVEGDSLRRVSWKTFAKGRGLFIKEFNESLSSENWLDFYAAGGKTTEEKLSILAFWVLHFYQEDENYGLILPHMEIRPNHGIEHRNECLTSLAEFL